MQDLSEILNASKIMAFVHVVQKLFWTIPVLISTRFYDHDLTSGSWVRDDLVLFHQEVFIQFKLYVVVPHY